MSEAGREVVLATENLTKTFNVHRRGRGRSGVLRAVNSVSGTVTFSGRDITQALLSAEPEIADETTIPRMRILLTGDVPDPMDGPSGCAFRTRCPYARERCATERPIAREVAPGRVTACHFPLLG